jgi:hypothetical protein
MSRGKTPTHPTRPRQRCSAASALWRGWGFSHPDLGYRGRNRESLLTLCLMSFTTGRILSVGGLAKQQKGTRCLEALL